MGAAEGCMHALGWLGLCTPYALHARLDLLRLPIYHAELHVRFPRLHVRLVGLACARLTRYTHASICVRSPIHHAELHVRCPRVHVRLVGMACVRLTRYTHVSICIRLPIHCAELHVRCPRLHVRLVCLCTPYTLHAHLDLFSFAHSPC